MAKKGASMVAPHPSADGKLHPVENLATAAGIAPHVLAGLTRAKGWAPGKQVTEAEFAAAVSAFDQRRMGSGKI